MLLCVFSFALGISAGPFLNFLLDILSTLFQIFPSFNGSFFDIFVSSFFFQSCGLFDFMLSFFIFFLNIASHFFDTFLNVAGSLFNVLLGLSDFSLCLCLWSYHLVNFFCCGFVNVLWDLLDLLPTLSDGVGDILDNARLLDLFFSFLQFLSGFFC